MIYSSILKNAQERVIDVHLKRTFLVVFNLTLMLNVFAQQEAWNWYFGWSAGVSFSSGNPVALTDGVLGAGEGVATISDSNGQLLFYTNGMTVYDATHSPMLNGTGLLGHTSSTQSGIIVKAPGSDSLFYVFTIGIGGSSTGFRYSIVDMSLNNDLGDVTVKNTLVRASTREKVTAARHANGTDFWILINDWSSDRIFAYHLSNSGLNMTPIQSNIGPFHGNLNNGTLGYMKVNRQNNKIAMALWARHRFAVMDFNNATGICSSRINIQGAQNTLGDTYGVEFSPDGTKLYGTTMRSPFRVIQFDLTAGNGATIFNTRTILTTTNSFIPPCNLYHYGALQLGPDGKIYGVSECGSFLNVIEHPDSLGTSCGYVANAVSLEGKTCGLGLPNFLSDYVVPICTTTTAIDIQTACNSYTWIDGNIYTESNNTATHTLTNAGGCDSIVTLNLTVRNTTAYTDIQTTCNSYTWIDGNTYTESNNTATYILENAAGCDSIVTLNLTIHTVDISVTSTESTLTANQSGASYKWLDCDKDFAIMPNETGQSFTPTTNGSYAVEITYNGCIGTSDCVAMTPVGVTENNDKPAFTVYPNPSQGIFIIETNEAQSHYEVYDTTGKLVLSGKNETQRFTVNLSHLPDGAYLLKVNEATRLLSKMR